MRAVLYGLLFLSLFTFVCGALPADAYVVVLDPNVSGKITAKMYSDTDSQLSQKVTYEAKTKPVQEIINDLREMTGVNLLAGAREADWVVRSRRMNIFVKDVPLYELMDSICRVMKFRWSRYDDKKPYIYRLKVIGKATAEADAMMKRAEEEQAKLWQKRRLDWLDAIEKYGDKPASELTPLRDSDPQIYEQALLGSLQAVHALFDEVPEAKERFIAGKNFRISTDLLSPETKKLCFSAGNEFWKHLQRIGYLCPKTQNPPGYGDVLREDDHFDIAYKRLDVGTFTPNLRWGSASISDTGYWHLMKEGRDFEINGFRYLGVPWNRRIAKSNFMINEGIDVDEVRAQETDRNTTLNARYEDGLKLEEYLYPSEPLIEHTPFPQLEMKISLKMDKPEPSGNRKRATTGDNIAYMQKALFEASGLNIVSDSWLNMPLSHGKEVTFIDVKLGDLLNALCTSINCNWDKPGDILEFRHRKWAKMRLNQIPDEWIAAWSKNTKANGYLCLEDLASISNITYYQAEESVRYDPVVGGSGTYYRMVEILDDNLPWLRLYSALNSNQKKLAAGDFGLNGHMLTSEQWKIAQPMFDRIGITRGEALMRSGIIAGDDPKSVTVWFKVIDLNTEETDRFWKFELPKYTPPKVEIITSDNQQKK